MWQTGVANARLEFSGATRFQIFIQKWLLENIKYFLSFKLKSLKVKKMVLDRTLICPNTDHQSASFLDVKIDFQRSKLAAQTKMKNLCYIAFSPFFPQMKSITCNIMVLLTNCEVHTAKH